MESCSQPYNKRELLSDKRAGLTGIKLGIGYTGFHSMVFCQDYVENDLANCHLAIYFGVITTCTKFLCPI